jgi:hypothetical protein
MRTGLFNPEYGVGWFWRNIVISVAHNGNFDTQDNEDHRLFNS